MEEIVEHVMAKMGDVLQIHLLGDYAKGLDTGTIEVMLIGENLDTSYISSLEKKLKSLLNEKFIFYN